MSNPNKQIQGQADHNGAWHLGPLVNGAKGPILKGPRVLLQQALNPGTWGLGPYQNWAWGPALTGPGAWRLEAVALFD